MLAERSQNMHNPVVTAGIATQLTHNWNTVINVWTPRTVKNLVWMRVSGTCGNVICHHDHDVLLSDSTVAQNLICLRGNQALWQVLSRLTTVQTDIVLHDDRQASAGSIHGKRQLGDGSFPTRQIQQ